MHVSPSALVPRNNNIDRLVDQDQPMNPINVEVKKVNVSDFELETVSNK